MSAKTFQQKYFHCVIILFNLFVFLCNGYLSMFFQDLHQAYDALVLCMGATWPRDINIPGRQLEGIYQAMAFLETWQKTQSPSKKKMNGYDPALSAKDKNVIILGIA